MSRRFIPGLFVVCLAVAGLVAADPADKPADPDEQPVRLKKKDKPAAKEDAPKPPAAENKKPEQLRDKDDGPPDVPDERMEDEQEILNRVLKNTRTAEERLANKEVGDPTKQLQRDILKDLDALIEATKRQQQDQQDDQQQQDQPQQGGAGQQSKQQKQQAGMSGARGSRGQKQQQARAGSQRGQRNQSGQQRQPGQNQDGQKDQQDTAQAGPSNQGGKGGTSSEEAGKLAEVYKDIWGHLPEALRAEMNSYSKEQFMDKYKDQLKRYYATIAEKGRKE